MTNTMRRSQEEKDELHRQLENIEKEWDFYKRSNPRRLYRRSGSAQVKSTADILQFLDNTSPVSSLHRRLPSEGGWKVRNNVLAVEEILRDRRTAIENGKLKGRSLFDALEDASKMDGREEEEICSASSSVLIETSEVRSLRSSSDDDGEEEEEDKDDNVVDDHQSISGYGNRSTCPSMERVGREKLAIGMEQAEIEQMGVGVGEKKVIGGDGERLMVVLGWLAVVLMVFALAIISLTSFDGYEDEGVHVPTLIPT
uniref:Uncharacterized protein n=1 Tax=Nelumbo nucifera TaxID=4432 RepID=A0A822YJ35_NELNU|nr:TPA_asm: hypothetical protein HUJ06_004844 [Nelumbo nucifera]